MSPKKFKEISRFRKTIASDNYKITNMENIIHATFYGDSSCGSRDMTLFGWHTFLNRLVVIRILSRFRLCNW